MATATVELPSGQKILFDVDGSGNLIQQTAKINDVSVEGTLTATAGEASEVKTTAQEGMTMLVAWFSGTYSTVTVVMEVSFNGGTTWTSLAGTSINAGAPTANPLSSNSNSTVGWEAAIPAGTTNIRARCSALTSGTVNVKLTQGSSNYETALGVTVGPASNTIGSTYSAGQWNDLSSTNLAASATFTGAAIDLLKVATATGFNNGSLGVGEYRISATSDKPGTLYLETSRDNVTFKRVKAAVMAKGDTTCENYAEIVHRPSERYARAVYVNGAEAQTSFKCQSVYVSNA